jgi:hypothetical protein
LGYVDLMPNTVHDAVAEGRIYHEQNRPVVHTFEQANPGHSDALRVMNAPSQGRSSWPAANGRRSCSKMVSTECADRPSPWLASFSHPLFNNSSWRIGIKNGYRLGGSESRAGKQLLGGMNASSNCASGRCICSAFD